jgi:hypothetical protein
MTDRRAPNWIIYEDGAHLQGNQRPVEPSPDSAHDDLLSNGCVRTGTLSDLDVASIGVGSVT